MFQDKTLTCADCGQEFAFSASEQQFYSDRQFSEPRRCPSCRASRKAARGSSSYSGGSSSSYGGYTGGSIGSYGGGSSGSGYSGGGYSGGGSRPPREMFTATCSSCGREARVPFRPTSGKPVYCNDCFASRRG
ncbi:MAG: zinc-ribbon domain containing protein [Chloroflexi bacterium]|nr:zinc-ribbon domain containing protein [Chloroflexota bacterium]